MSDGTQGTYFEVVETVLGMVSRQCVRIEEIVKFGMDENVDDEVCVVLCFVWEFLLTRRCRFNHALRLRRNHLTRHRHSQSHAYT